MGWDGHVTAVTSRAARHAAITAKLGARRRELGAAVVAEPAGTGHRTAAAAAAAVGGPGTCWAAAASRHRHRPRRAVPVAGAVAVRAAATVRLARWSVGTVTGRSRASSPANVTGTSVLRAATITTS